MKVTAATVAKAIDDGADYIEQHPGQWSRGRCAGAAQGGERHPLPEVPGPPLVSTHVTRISQLEAEIELIGAAHDAVEAAYVGAQQEILHLRDELQALLDEFEDALPYVPDYFRDKWGYDDAVTRAKAALA